MWHGLTSLNPHKHHLKYDPLYFEDVGMKPNVRPIYAFTQLAYRAHSCTKTSAEYHTKLYGHKDGKVIVPPSRSKSSKETDM
jgi:hypothetical protein